MVGLRHQKREREFPSAQLLILMLCVLYKCVVGNPKIQQQRNHNRYAVVTGIAWALTFITGLSTLIMQQHRPPKMVPGQLQQGQLGQEEKAYGERTGGIDPVSRVAVGEHKTGTSAKHLRTSTSGREPIQKRPLHILLAHCPDSLGKLGLKLSIGVREVNTFQACRVLCRLYPINIAVISVVVSPQSERRGMSALDCWM